MNTNRVIKLIFVLSFICAAAALILGPQPVLAQAITYEFATTLGNGSVTFDPALPPDSISDFVRVTGYHFDTTATLTFNGTTYQGAYFLVFNDYLDLYDGFALQDPGLPHLGLTFWGPTNIVPGLTVTDLTTAMNSFPQITNVHNIDTWESYPNGERTGEVTSFAAVPEPATAISAVVMLASCASAAFYCRRKR